MSSQKPSTDDDAFMAAALGLARRGLGSVWPNPAVGCVLVREDRDRRVVGRGWTQPGGRPHAETEALSRAGGLARGATAYVSMEPCNHHGRTEPCSRALIEAGVARVVIAIEDPDPRVAGTGITALKESGIDISVGTRAGEAASVNAGFLMRIERGRPLFMLKAATSMDGKIATSRGDSQWITGETARRAGHMLRATHDAIMIGIDTALADRPRLTCRLPGMEERSPVRVVADSRLRLPSDHPLVETAKKVPTWVYTADDADPDAIGRLQEAGVVVVAMPPDERAKPDLGWLASDLAQRGLTRVLVEGGAGLAAEFLRRDLIDRIAWFRAPIVIGGDGLSASGGFGVEALDQSRAFRRVALSAVGADTLEIYEHETFH